MGAIIFFLLSSVPFFSEKGVMYEKYINNLYFFYFYKQIYYDFSIFSSCSSKDTTL